VCVFMTDRIKLQESVLGQVVSQDDIFAGIHNSFDLVGISSTGNFGVNVPNTCFFVPFGLRP